MKNEPKDLFRVALTKSEIAGEVGLDVYMGENTLNRLTTEQIEKVYSDIVAISNYICDCTVSNKRK